MTYSFHHFAAHIHDRKHISMPVLAIIVALFEHPFHSIQTTTVIILMPKIDQILIVNTSTQATQIKTIQDLPISSSTDYYPPRANLAYLKSVIKLEAMPTYIATPTISLSE